MGQQAAGSWDQCSAVVAAAREALGGALADSAVASKLNRAHAQSLGMQSNSMTEVSWSSSKMLTMSSSSATEYELLSTAKASVSESTD